MVNQAGLVMDVRGVIKSRLEELGLEQKDLAAAAEVTESYVSQLLTRKKLPPAPDRTDIYEKLKAFSSFRAANWQNWRTRSAQSN